VGHRHAGPGTHLDQNRSDADADERGDMVPEALATSSVPTGRGCEDATAGQRGEAPETVVQPNHLILFAQPTATDRHLGAV